MQYFFTEEEFNNLRAKKDYEDLRKEIKILESAFERAGSIPASCTNV